VNDQSAVQIWPRSKSESRWVYVEFKSSKGAINCRPIRRLLSLPKT